MQGRMCVGVSNTVCFVWGISGKTEHKLFTCCRILFRQCHQRVAGTRLVVHQAFGRDVANDLIALCWLHLHRDILQDLIVQGVRAVKLNGRGEQSQLEALSRNSRLTVGIAGARCQLVNSCLYLKNQSGCQLDACRAHVSV